MKTVAVTGASGFIGLYTVEELVSRGYDVIAFDHSDRREYPWPKNTELMLGDVRDQVAMTELAAHSDGIIHLAAALGTQETITNPRPAVMTNIEGGLNFLEAINQYDLPGTYICVGNTGMYNSYSLSKTTIENFCHMYNNDRGGKINQVRAYNAYGPRQRVAPPFGPGKVRKITPAFACRALLGMPIEVYGDGSNISDMVSVKDVARALVGALEHADQGVFYDRPIEVGPKHSNSVLEIATLIRDLAEEITNGVRSEIVHLPMRPGETKGMDVKADVSTLVQAGIDPDSFVSIDIGMREAVQWFYNQFGVHWDAPKE